MKKNSHLKFMEFIVVVIVVGLFFQNLNSIYTYAAESKELVNSSINVGSPIISSKLYKDQIVASYIKKVPVGTTIKAEDVLVIVYEEEPRILMEFKELYFVKQKDVIKKTIKNKDGTVSNITETVTEESKLFEVNAGKNEIIIRLYDDGKKNSPKETVFEIEGTDSVPPTFKEVKLSDYKITNKDNPVTIMVSMSGQDNNTKEKNLLFAIKEKEVLAKEADYSEKKEQSITVKKNETYVAYVKDAAGNVTTKEIVITITDKEAPTIVSKSLAFEDDWNTKNIIRIKASDNYEPEKLQYRFVKTKAEIKEPFGVWSENNEVIITENGNYEIEAKDVAGNITKTTIDVNNIDGESPANIEIKEVS